MCVQWTFFILSSGTVHLNLKGIDAAFIIDYVHFSLFQDTGRCYECEHNTVGDYCERCRDGYYGNALTGGAESCHRCACPLPAPNSFSSTCRQSQSAGRGYVCDACRAGYTGHYCESCAVGYYGDPSVSGGQCLPCACHVYGSVHGACNNVTGQCECRGGVAGRDCSVGSLLFIVSNKRLILKVCQERHAFLNGVCTCSFCFCYQFVRIFYY